MRPFLWTLRAIWLQQWATARSYRWALLGELALRLPHVLMLLLLGHYVDERVGTGQYFTFAVVGVALLALTMRAVSSSAGFLLQMQRTGHGQVFFIGPASTARVVLALNVMAWPRALAELASALLLAVLLGARFEPRWGWLLLTLLLALWALMPVGLMAAAGVLLWRQRDLVTLAFGTAAYVLSGVYYPLSVLPSGVQALAQWLPTTHLLALCRSGLIESTPVSWAPFVWLLGLGALLWLIAWFLLGVALKRREERGDLMVY